MVQIYSVYKRSVRNWNGTVPYGITFISGPVWYQIADPIRTGSNRSRVSAALVYVGIQYETEERGYLDRLFGKPTLVI